MTAGHTAEAQLDEMPRAWSPARPHDRVVAELQLHQVISGRTGWHAVTEVEATYTRSGADWIGRVARLGNLAPGVGRRWHAAVIVGDVVERARTAWNPAEAVEWVESWR